MNAQSPFIEGTHFQFAWDSTSFGWLKECPRKYYYYMILGISPVGESIHLRYGILYHQVCEKFDKLRTAGVDKEDAIRQCVRWLLEETVHRDEAGKVWPWDTKHASKTRESLIRAFIWYIEAYITENSLRYDPAEVIVLKNGQPAIELSFRLDLDLPTSYGSHYVLTGHMDKLVTFQGNLYVSDKKTTTRRLDDKYFAGFSPDNQMSLYTLAGRLIFNTPISGVIIDAMQVTVGYSDFKRQMTYRTPEMLNEWLKTAQYWLRQSERYAEENEWPMNDKACLAGTTIVNLSRGKMKGKRVKIQQLYDMFHGKDKSPRFNSKLDTYILANKGGYVGYQKILDVIYKGKQQTLIVNTASGKSIRATADHKVLTLNDWKEIRDLTINDSIAAWRESRRQGNFGKTHSSTSKVICRLRYHPFAWKVSGYNSQLRMSRLIIEAELNNISVEEFIHILRTNNKQAKTLQFLANEYEVHHKDRKSDNDSALNLEVLTKHEHYNEHKAERAITLNKTFWDRVVSVKEAEIEDVYDIEVEHPYHNFIANGLTVHNCHMYDGCPFRAVCSTTPSLRDNVIKTKYVPRTWNPLESRT
jgi:hypothetical protein